MKTQATLADVPLFELIEASAIFAGLAEAYGGHVRADPYAPVDGEDLEKAQVLLVQLRAAAEQAGFEATAAVASTSLQRLTSGWPIHREIAQIAREIRTVITYELPKAAILRIGPEDVELYRHPQPFGEAAVRHFSSTLQDGAEAAKCLALCRFTASAFHCMRVVESLVNRACGDLGIEQQGPSWDAMLRRMDRKFQENDQAGGVEWQLTRLYWRELFLRFDAVRVAWRHPTMHADRTYSREEAREIFAATKALVRVMAENLEAERK